MQTPQQLRHRGLGSQVWPNSYLEKTLKASLSSVALFFLICYIFVDFLSESHCKIKNVDLDGQLLWKDVASTTNVAHLLRAANETLTNVAKLQSPEMGKSSNIKAAAEFDMDSINIAFKYIPPRPLPAPMTTKKGGILYYIHIVKTGGTTVRSFLNSRTKLTVAKNGGNYNRMVTNIFQLIQNGTGGKVHAFETHASTVPSYMKISSTLREWRAAAAKAGIPFFAFTLLREPQSMQISCFNYYYLAPRRKIVLANDTTQEFVNTLLIDPQCHFLSQGGGFYAMLDGHIRRDDILEKRNAKINDEICEKAYGVLFNDMDWIGSTETMTKETLPLLNYLAGTKGEPEAENKSPKLMTMGRLDEQERQALAFSTRRDEKYYKAMKLLYRFDPWNEAVMKAQA